MNKCHVKTCFIERLDKRYLSQINVKGNKNVLSDKMIMSATEHGVVKTGLMLCFPHKDN